MNKALKESINDTLHIAFTIRLKTLHSPGLRLIHPFIHPHKSNKMHCDFSH